MFSHVQLRDFKPDVVICPHCTQHLMGVKDVQWATDGVSFTYGCAGCGHEIDRPVSEEAIPASWSNAKACTKADTMEEPAADVTLMDDLGTFPFRKPRDESRPFVFEADEAGLAGSQAAADDLPDDAEHGDGITDDPDGDEEPAPFGSMRLLPPQPSWLDAPVFGQRPALTPKQVFDVERRETVERHEGPVPEAAAPTRASALLRDVSIFSL
jgi:hypothetical protein